MFSCANSNTSNFKLGDSSKVLSTYKLYSSWLGNGEFSSNKKIDYEIIEEVKDIYGNPLESIRHIRFYENNKVMLFSIPRDDEAKNYNTDSIVGTVGSFEERDGILYLKYKLGIGHTLRIVKSRAIIYGDTLQLIEEISNPVSHQIYIRVADK